MTSVMSGAAPLPVWSLIQRTVAAPSLQRYRDWIWLASAGVSPILAYVASMGFAATVALAGLLYAPFLLRQRRMSPGFAMLGVLLIWCLITYSWSPALPQQPDFSKYKQLESITGLKLVFEFALYGTFFLGATRITSKNGRLGFNLFGLLTLAIAAIAFTDALDGGRVYVGLRELFHQRIRSDLELRDLDRVSYPLAVWAAPLTLAMTRSPWPRLAPVLALTIILACLALGKDATVAALIMALGAYLAVRYGGKRAIWACMSACVVYFTLAPLAVALVLDHVHLTANGVAQVGKMSWAARLDIWRLAEQLIEQKPFTGWGLDAARTIQGIPLHPHNAALQIWLELGLPGATIAAMLFTWFFYGIGELQAEDAEMAGAAAGAVAAYLVIGALSFGVWQEWWLGLGGLTAGMIAVDAVARVNERARARKDDFMPMIE
jgi:O-antigen ligase